MKRQITMERVYKAAVEDVWEMWTTKAGIEAWWGPDGFEVEVTEIDLRVGGTMRYVMRAVAAPMVDFMKKSGMPVASPHSVIYTRVEAPSVLEYQHAVDFVPGVEPYEVLTRVEISATAAGARMLLTFDVMHDDMWTERASQGYAMELDELGRVLQAHRGGVIA